MKKISSKLLTIITAFVVILGPVTTVAAEEVKNEFIILHTNDVHGQIDPKVNELALLKAYKDKVGASFMFDAGDASQGLPLNNITKGARLAEIYNAIGYDAMTLGNHEFDYSRDAVLAKESGFFSSALFPIVSANIYFNEDSEAGEVAGDSVFEKSRILTRNINGEDYTFSIIGVTTPETKVKADPRNSAGMDFTDPLPELKTELATDDHKETDYVVVLSHLGTDKETKEEWRGDYVAEQLSKDPELKDRKIIFIDGHSHTEEPNGLKFGNNVLYGQTGGTLGTFGEMTINLGDFSQSVARTVKVRDGYSLDAGMENLIPDPVVKGIIDEAAGEFDTLAGYTVVENSPYKLTGDRAFARTRETNLGRLISDSMYEYASKRFEGVDLAVMNGGGIRADLASGKITFKDILTVLPYGNRVVTIEVTGEDIKAMFEHGLKAAVHETEVDDNGLPLLQSDPAILHVSHTVSLKFDPRLPAGSRVSEILIKGEPLKLDKTYKLATLEFLAVGGDGFTMLGGAREEGENDADIFRDHLMTLEDWSAYEEDVAVRVVTEPKFEEVAARELGLLLQESLLYTKDSTKYTKESYEAFNTAMVNAANLKNLIKGDKGLTDITYDEYLAVYTELRNAIDNLEEVTEVPEVPVTPEKPEVPTTPEKPTTPPTTEKPADKNDVNTGVEAADYSSLYFALALAAVSSGGYVLLRRKMEN